MSRIKPFRGLRPPKEYVTQVQCRPYDVLNSEEARCEAADNEKSLYHITKPEIDFPQGTSEYTPEVYERAVDNFAKFQKKGWLVQDNKEMYYLYAQTMHGRTQYGWVVAVSVEDYINGFIKRHELTRSEKEEDRMKHIRANNANIEPVFFAYPDNLTLLELANKIITHAPEYDFVAPGDGFRHQLWLIDQESDIQIITHTFSQIPYLYIADGHHRSAAAALVGAEKAQQNPSHRGDEEYNYFMAVCFPASQLTILDYNRVVRDLNNLTEEAFLQALSTHFGVKPVGSEAYRPCREHEFGLYLAGKWYCLTLKEELCNELDPIKNLDVTISSEYILDNILGIKDLRTSKRIDFVGGLRGLHELERRVDSGEMKMALALYPISMKQIIQIADAGMTMPPKATWFEPKLRSGLVIHKLT